MAKENSDSSFGSLAQGFGIDMAHAVGKGFISTLFNNHAQKRALEANKDLMREQAMQQYQNNLNAGQVTKQSKQRAGMNVNTAGDFSPSLTPPQSNSPALGADIAGGGSLIPQLMLSGAQVEQMKANARLTNAEAGLKERKLKGEQEADKIITEGEFKYSSFTDENGVWNFQILKERNTKATTREGYDAVKDVTKWLRQDLSQIKAEEAQNTLKQYVAQEQITNGALYSLAKMPIEQFNLLVKEKEVQNSLASMYFKQGELFVAEADLKKLEKTIQENTNLGAIFEEISNDFKSGNYLEALGGIIKGIFFAFMSVAGVNIGFNRGRVTSSNTSNSTVNSTSRSTVNSTVRHLDGTKP